MSREKAKHRQTMGEDEHAEKYVAKAQMWK